MNTIIIHVTTHSPQHPSSLTHTTLTSLNLHPHIHFHPTPICCCIAIQPSKYSIVIMPSIRGSGEGGLVCDECGSAGVWRVMGWVSCHTSHHNHHVCIVNVNPIHHPTPCVHHISHHHHFIHIIHSEERMGERPSNHILNISSSHPITIHTVFHPPHSTHTIHPLPILPPPLSFHTPRTFIAFTSAPAAISTLITST